MGIEDFGVLLRPAQPLSADLVERELLSHGFLFAGRGSLPRERTYVLCDNTKNIEALLKYDAADETMASCLSIRYAICQPEAATQAFLAVVSQFVCNMPLQIEGIDSEKTYSRETLNEFCEFVLERVAKAKSRWSSLFEQDMEEVVLSVADSWKYFIAKHPQVLRSKHQLVG